MSNFDQKLINNGQVFDGLSPGGQLVRLTFGGTTFWMMNLNQEMSQANGQRWTDVDKCSANKNYFIKFADLSKENETATKSEKLIIDSKS